MRKNTKQRKGGNNDRVDNRKTNRCYFRRQSKSKRKSIQYNRGLLGKKIRKNDEFRYGKNHGTFSSQQNKKIQNFKTKKTAKNTS